MLPGSDLLADTEALAVENSSGKNSDHETEPGSLKATKDEGQLTYRINIKQSLQI